MIEQAKSVAQRLRRQHYTSYDGMVHAADTIDGLCAEVERLRGLIDRPVKTYAGGIPNYVDSATRSADSAEPFCKTKPCLGNKCQRCEVVEKTCETCRHNGDDDRCYGCYENHEWEGK